MAKKKREPTNAELIAKMQRQITDNERVDPADMIQVMKALDNRQNFLESAIDEIALVVDSMRKTNERDYRTQRASAVIDLLKCFKIDRSEKLTHEAISKFIKIIEEDLNFKV